MSGSVDSRQGIYNAIDAKFRTVYHELMKNERVNRNCLVILRKAHKLWPSSVKYLKNGLRQEIATILKRSQETLASGTPIWVEIDRIIGLLLPPEFASVATDILDLWIYSSNEDGTLMEILSACGRVWAEARERGSLDFLTAKKERQSHMTTLPYSVYRYVKTTWGHGTGNRTPRTRTYRHCCGRCGGCACEVERVVIL